MVSFYFLVIFILQYETNIFLFIKVFDKYYQQITVSLKAK